jgi:hypothetical protein
MGYGQDINMRLIAAGLSPDVPWRISASMVAEK